MNRSGKIKKFAGELLSAWQEEKPSRLAAALAYYGMFSFVPVVYIAVRIASLFVRDPGLTQVVFLRLSIVLGTETAAYVQELVNATDVVTGGGSTLATLVSVAALFYSASGLFTNLQYSLNVIWHAPESEKNGIFQFIKNRLLAFVLVIGAGLLMVLGAFSSAAISILASYFPIAFPSPGISLLAFGALATLSFALIYKILPEVAIAWRDVWLGAAITALLVIIGGWMLGLYFSISGVGTAFEAAGALAVLLIGIYYLAQLFLSGAIFTRVYAGTFGSLANAPRES